ncbi:flagellar filament capping protein FliD [Nocardioides humilatus]|uniref:Flagellar hook-associated protein 2 n=1 Tax=Nocardioides humilatus TaxID=2607660 RepID=A0A5B1LDN1_9ACTN|nr:flagellar filament capping protein FliD [Nocardioides humilatus]KAA1417717.1 flagellar filament capping protein FliD [Nocardioides humilatus]
MATASIGGLASGLDTATIINQLLQLESQPQTQLKSKVTSEQAKLGALQSLNSRLAGLASAAKDLAHPSSTTSSVWESLKATSTNSAVTATATTAATPSSYTVTIGHTALSHRVSFTDAHATTDLVTGGSTTIELDRQDGGSVVSLSVGTGTLQEVADAINKPTNNTGLRATLVQVGTGSYRLMVESTATGELQDFSLALPGGAPLLGGAASVQTGRDAQIEVGGITVGSTTNTFTNVTPGVTLTLGANATGTADVVVARDASARSAAVKKVVDQMNGILSTIAGQTAHDADATKAGVLSGNSLLPRVASEMLGTIYPEDDTSLAPYGIEVDRTGHLTFDESKFAAAYAADPDAVTAAITGDDGFAARVQKVTELVSDKYTGSLTSMITSSTAGIARLNDNISDWDARLAQRRSTLERQYSALEVTLGQLQSQASWLSSQLSSLSSNNG